MQFNPEGKNNLHPLFLLESPANDGLLQFKYLILKYMRIMKHSYLPPRVLAPVSVSLQASWFLFN